ncbi:MAG TPA: four helix bundle protein [Thermodesulfobacteriota bacterium]|jgi:four helix bundle protein|nr:four helix bundle protein [Thermodesulfobacteriota bacterium]
MADIKSFNDLLVWQKAHRLFLEIVKLVEKLPKNRVAMVISDQILRSVSSISANIAEGYGRRGKDYERFLTIARGSTTESEDWLIKLKDLGLMEEYIYKQIMGECEEIIRMINGLLSSLRKQRE